MVFADVAEDRSAFIFTVYRFKKSNRANNTQTDQSITKLTNKLKNNSERDLWAEIFVVWFV
jgi:hypothetical protein